MENLMSESSPSGVTLAGSGTKTIRGHKEIWGHEGKNLHLDSTVGLIELLH